MITKINQENKTKQYELKKTLECSVMVSYISHASIETQDSKLQTCHFSGLGWNSGQSEF